MSNEALLHVHNQYAHHGEVFIVGNRAGLLALQAAIEAALQPVVLGHGQACVMVADGEGYDVHVVCDDSDWRGEIWQHRVLPYTADYARSSDSPENINPWDGLPNPDPGDKHGQDS